MRKPKASASCTRRLCTLVFVSPEVIDTNKLKMKARCLLATQIWNPLLGIEPSSLPSEYSYLLMRILNSKAA